MARDVLGSRLSALGGNQSVAALVEAISGRLNGRVAQPKAEGRELIAALLDVPKHWPLLHENKWLEGETWSAALSAADKRASGAPLAYAVGKASFRGLTLAVDERVLIPRPETELLVELVLARRSTGTVVDVGTGSGCIALSLAAEGGFDRVIATDISRDALDVASGNARRVGLRNVDFVHGDLLSAVRPRPSAMSREPRAESRERFSVVVSNPPYVSFNEIRELPASVRDWEPATALFSANDGMAATTRLVRQAAEALEAGGLLALEVDARRASLVAELLAADWRYSDVGVQLDYAGRERFVLATRREH